MVFSSIPAYLDPANWQQQPNHHQAGTNNTNPHHQLQTPTQLAAQPTPLGGGGGGGSVGSIRPGSMAERARLANIPMPEGPLKCPRCESTNTKFCYFNNYSLTQPRHFCKTCRRYWTRGGALRSVPVGGGCRRNKRSSKSSSSSKSSPASAAAAAVAGGDRQTNSSPTSNVSSSSNLLGLTSQLSPLRFMSPLGHQLSDHFNNPGGDINLNPLAGISSEMNFHLGSNLLGGCGSGGGVASILSGGFEQWRMQQQHQPHQQFPGFLTGLDTSLYGFQAGGVDQHTGGFVGGGSSSEASHHHVRPKFSTGSMLTQLASVKVEDNQELNLSRQFSGINNAGNDQWNINNSNAWTDLSSFSSSSTSNPL